MDDGRLRVFVQSDKVILSYTELTEPTDFFVLFRHIRVIRVQKRFSSHRPLSIVYRPNRYNRINSPKELPCTTKKFSMN